MAALHMCIKMMVQEHLTFLEFEERSLERCIKRAKNQIYSFDSIWKSRITLEMPLRVCFSNLKMSKFQECGFDGDVLSPKKLLRIANCSSEFRENFFSPDLLKKEFVDIF